MSKSRFILKSVACLAGGLMGISVYGGTIVPDLSDGSTFFSSTVALSNATPSGLTLANGLTLAAEFTPDATDVANSANGAVAVLEIGGTTSGSGFWIINGNLWYLSKSGSASAVPSSTLDLNASDKAIGVELGAVTAGAQLNVYASLNTSSGVLLIGDNSVINSYTLTGITSAWNWEGATTAALDFGLFDTFVTSVGPPAKLGRNGGLADVTSGGNAFGDTTLYNMDGSLALGQMFNAVSTAVPEPSSLALAACGGVAVWFLRRRKS